MDQAAPGFKRFALPIIAVLFLLDIVGMLVFKLRGGDATALLGGTVGIVMVFVGIGAYGQEGFGNCRSIPYFRDESCITHFLIPFPFLSASLTAKAVFGEGAKACSLIWARPWQIQCP